MTTSDTKFLWCALEPCETCDSTGATVAKRYFAQGVQDAGTAYFYTRDHLGSVLELTDARPVRLSWSAGSRTRPGRT